MRTPEQFISDYLSHEYDPVYAKAYYERTKKLKGRKKGAAKAPSDGPASGRPTATKAPPPKAKATAAAPPSRGKRLQELNARLTRLKEVLDLLDQKVAAAQARSGVEGVAKKTAASKKSADSKDKSADKKTASEKKADAKAAKERYEKNKNPETAKGAQAVQDEIEAVQKKIADARAELTKALAAAAARKKSASPKPTTASGRPTKSKEGDRQNGA